MHNCENYSFLFSLSLLYIYILHEFPFVWIVLTFSLHLNLLLFISKLWNKIVRFWLVFFSFFFPFFNLLGYRFRNQYNEFIQRMKYSTFVADEYNNFSSVLFPTYCSDYVNNVGGGGLSSWIGVFSPSM